MEIPSRCTFRRLHRVIQETFGWFDYHLHEFTVPDATYVPEEYTSLYAWPIKLRIVDGEDPEAEDYIAEDGNCRLGACRPESCKKYPYTDQPDRWASLYSVLDVIEVCPVAFEIYERLKKEYVWRYRR